MGIEGVEKFNEYHMHILPLLVLETKEHLQSIVNEYERGCDKIRLQINVGKSEVLVVKNSQRGSCEKVRVSGNGLQMVEV